MLMDLFYDEVPVEKKQRVHFHSFMLDVHSSKLNDTLNINFILTNEFVIAHGDGVAIDDGCTVHSFEMEHLMGFKESFH